VNDSEEIESEEDDEVNMDDLQRGQS